MAEIIPTSVTRRRRAGVQRMKRHSVKTDMTPMVDLGFLLITFFVFTVQLGKPVAMQLSMHKESADSTEVGNSNALTVLLDNDKVYYYHGNWDEATASNRVVETNLSVMHGLGHVIREKQKWLDMNSVKEKRDGLMLLIKPGKAASYKMVIDALDEALINKVKKYALVKPTAAEAAWLENK